MFGNGHKDESDWKLDWLSDMMIASQKQMEKDKMSQQPLNNKIDWSKPIEVINNPALPCRLIFKDRKNPRGYTYIVLVQVSPDEETIYNADVNGCYMGKSFLRNKAVKKTCYVGIFGLVGGKQLWASPVYYDKESFEKVTKQYKAAQYVHIKTFSWEIEVGN